ncbi:AAA family ATPase [Rhodovulum sp. DZ06]|uniref:AAA family ATPase n=1 Tax=Rhodovulum sp. DZ06 TaxID=3425126 RepID=UPI003D34654D
MDPVLVILSGRSGVGKSAAARALAARTGAFWLRIDSIEDALRSCSLKLTRIEDAGYAAAMAAARDNLSLGRIVIADMVNPWELTRDAWRGVAAEAGARALDVEILCSDEAEHRRRVETRRAATGGGPDWHAVLARDYRPHARPVLRIDAAALTPHQAAARIAAALTPPSSSTP